MPLTTTCTWSVVSKCGWALASLTRPWVAHRVWPIPVLAGRVASATPPLPASRSTAATRFSRLPTARTESISPSAITETPAESYPRYSSFCRPASRISCAARLPTYPTMPHIRRLTVPTASRGGPHDLDQPLANGVGLLGGGRLDHHADQLLGPRRPDQHAAAALQLGGLAVRCRPEIRRRHRGVAVLDR